MKLPAIRPLTPALSKLMVYHYVHEKHKDLVPKINQVFIEMEKSGELERIREQEIQKILGDIK